MWVRIQRAIGSSVRVADELATGKFVSFLTERWKKFPDMMKDFLGFCGEKELSIPALTREIVYSSRVSISFRIKRSRSASCKQIPQYGVVLHTRFFFIRNHFIRNLDSKAQKSPKIIRNCLGLSRIF